MPTVDITEYRRRLEERLARSREAFKGKYKEQLDELMGLSRAEIDAIMPESETDLEAYDRMIAIVQEASAANIAQAEMVGQLKELGEIGKRIAAKVPHLAALMV